jgi:hypothetical protein
MTLSACVAKNIDDLSLELRTASVVSMRGPGAPLAPTGRWAWMAGSRMLIESEALDPIWVENEVKSALISAMEDKGWSLAGSGGVAVELGYMVASDRELDDAELASTYGLSPGLSGANTRYGKGTLVVELRRPGTRMALWRGSVQIIADPTLPKDVRRQRILNGVYSVLRSVPIDS